MRLSCNFKKWSILCQTFNYIIERHVCKAETQIQDSNWCCQSFRSSFMIVSSFVGSSDCSAEVNPDCTAEVNPDCTAEVNPECTAEVNPECTADVNPECTADVNPECTVDVNPECTAEVWLNIYFVHWTKFCRLLPTFLLIYWNGVIV